MSHQTAQTTPVISSMKVDAHLTHMTSFVRHEQCPKCAKLGNDRGHNNLGIYADGSAWCFSCGYFKPASGIEKLKAKAQDNLGGLGKTVYLPGDVDFELPKKSWDYLRQYSLTEEDIHANKIMWSESYQRTIFPYFGKDGLLGWQGRTHNPSDKRKWYSQGNLKDLLHICSSRGSSTTKRSIALVEDIISAIRVGHVLQATPLFGSHLSLNQALRIHLLADVLILWLDKDKEQYSIQRAKQLRDLGIPTYSVISDQDPKCYNNKEVEELLLTIC